MFSKLSSFKFLIDFSAVVKKKSLFDDRPVEIQELTHVVRQDIGKLNKQIQELEQYTNSHPAELSNNQTLEHSSGVIVSLQSKLASTSITLKNVLEVRSEVNSHVMLISHNMHHPLYMHSLHCFYMDLSSFCKNTSLSIICFHIDSGAVLQLYQFIFIKQIFTI